MTDSAVSIITDTLRTHQFRLGKRDSFPVVFFAACSGCDWSTVALGEEGWSEHADHVAAAVVDALGGLERETQFKYTRLGTGRWTILESTDVQVARKIAGTTHELAEVTRWVSNWAEVTPDD